MRVLAFDQSLTSTARVVLEESDGRLSLIEKSVFQPKTRGIRRIVDIRYWMFMSIEGWKPHLIVRELHNQRQFGAAAALQGLAALIDVMCDELEFLKEDRYAMITAGTWKKFCVGKGNLKKDTAYLIHLNKFIKNNPFLNVHADFSVTNDNIADAICLAITGWAARKLKTGEDIKISDMQKDTLQKAIPVMFEYNA